MITLDIKDAPSRPTAVHKLSQQAISRILSKVGEKYASLDIDQNMLCADIEVAAKLWRGKQLDRRHGERKRRLKQALLRAQRLRRFIDKHRLRYAIDIAFGEPKAIDHLIADLEKALTMSPPLFVMAGTINTEAPSSNSLNFARNEPRSPIEWLTGSLLADVFKKHFKREANISRQEDAPSGPYIRFAEQCLKELGITNNGVSYALETIVSARQNSRKGRTRGKRPMPESRIEITTKRKR